MTGKIADVEKGLERKLTLNDTIKFHGCVLKDKSMDETEKVVEHLKMTQAVINRLGTNSFWVKSWSMILIVAAMVLIAKQNIQNSYFVLVLILPVLGFWILDGYFLWQERLFRQVYGEVRVQSNTDFEMNPMKHKNKPKCSWLSAIFSPTLVIFYIVEIVFIIGVFVIIQL